MKQQSKKFVFAMLACACSIAVLAGCSSADDTSPAESQSAESQPTESQSAESQSEETGTTEELPTAEELIGGIASLNLDGYFNVDVMGDMKLGNGDDSASMTYEVTTESDEDTYYGTYTSKVSMWGATVNTNGGEYISKQDSGENLHYYYEDDAEWACGTTDKWVDMSAILSGINAGILKDVAPTATDSNGNYVVKGTVTYEDAVNVAGEDYMTISFFTETSLDEILLDAELTFDAATSQLSSVSLSLKEGTILKDMMDETIDMAFSASITIHEISPEKAGSIEVPEDVIAKAGDPVTITSGGVTMTLPEDATDYYIDEEGTVHVTIGEGTDSVNEEDGNDDTPENDNSSHRLPSLQLH